MGLRRLIRRLRIFERRWIPDTAEREQHDDVVQARLHRQRRAADELDPPPPDDEPSPGG